MRAAGCSGKGALSAAAGGLAGSARACAFGAGGSPGLLVSGKSGELFQDFPGPAIWASWLAVSRNEQLEVALAVLA